MTYPLSVNFEWDEKKNLINQQKHGVSFEEARGLFESNVDYLEIFDSDHSDFEDRFIAIGPIRRGLLVVDRAVSLPLAHGSNSMTEIPELTGEQLGRAIPARLRKRLMQGKFESGEDIAALRAFVGLTQTDFARAIEISVH